MVKARVRRRGQYFIAQCNYKVNAHLPKLSLTITPYVGTYWFFHSTELLLFTRIFARHEFWTIRAKFWKMKDARVLWQSMLHEWIPLFDWCRSVNLEDLHVDFTRSSVLFNWNHERNLHRTETGRWDSVPPESELLEQLEQLAMRLEQWKPEIPGNK